MPNLLLYLIVVLVWGSTWIMIRFQVGVVEPELSVAYRFAIASVCMLLWAWLLRLPLRFSPRDHMFIALQGALIFSVNFFLFYQATNLLTTGLIAVVFSTSSILTMLVSSVLRRRLPDIRLILGTLLGITGVGAIFWTELATFDFGSGAGYGLLLSVGGTFCFSLGGIVSGRNQAAGLSVRGSTAWAMAYGTLVLFTIMVIKGGSLNFDPSLPYVSSLLFLAIFGSVLAFACYFALIARIGAERAAYATVLFPIVALSISTVFEGYQWSTPALVGVVLTIIGNVMVLMLKTKT